MLRPTLFTILVSSAVGGSAVGVLKGPTWILLMYFGLILLAGIGLFKRTSRKSPKCRRFELDVLYRDTTKDRFRILKTALEDIAETDKGPSGTTARETLAWLERDENASA